MDRKGKIGSNIPSFEGIVPDYEILDTVAWQYKPEDSYFCRTTKGCARKCPFCAVWQLERRFLRNEDWRKELREVRNKFGERQHLVLLDNNVLAHGDIEEIIGEIRREGFEKGATLNNRLRAVDFNQGIDARMVTGRIAKCLASINLRPVRLAFDYDQIEPSYRKAIQHLAGARFRTFTNYLMFNYNDSPKSLYRRMKINLEISRQMGVDITGFPMRYIPTTDVNRQYVSTGWNWRYLRGIQCVLLATHGMVSPCRRFFNAAFGGSFSEFLEILSMPDRYIIQREQYKNDDAKDWRRRFQKLSTSDKEELLEILAVLNGTKEKKAQMAKHRKFAGVLEHYYPEGKVLSE
ncbi:MAG: radical SAM protein [Thermoguttaceae bacterium]